MKLFLHSSSSYSQFLYPLTNLDYTLHLHVLLFHLLQYIPILVFLLDLAAGSPNEKLFRK